MYPGPGSGTVFPQIELTRMVREVNQTQVEADEILSDQVYYYDRQQEKLYDVEGGNPACFFRKSGSISQNYR